MGDTRKPFWQTLLVTVATAAGSAAGSYYLATDDAGTANAQQAVRVDLAYQWCRDMFESLDDRVGRLEDRALNRRGGGTVRLTPPEELFGREDRGVPRTDSEDALTPDRAPRPVPLAPKSLPKQLPTPNASDPAVQQYK